MRVPDANDPFKDPSWRWQRARWLLEKNKSSRNEDGFVKLARDFLSEEKAAETDYDKESLRDAYPHIWAARELYRSKFQDQKWTLEAALLGRATPLQAAGYCRCEPGTVSWYEKLFFNVLPDLGHDAYILNVVMGRSIHQGIKGRDYDLLWKLLSYAHGHLFLMEWLRQDSYQKMRSGDEFGGLLSGGYRRRMSHQGLVAAHAVPTSFNHGVIFEAWSRIQELDKTQGGPEQQALIINNIQAALTAMPFTAGRHGILESGRYGSYDEQSAELRAHEQFQIALGFEGDDHRQTSAWKFPDPPAKADDQKPKS